MYVSREPGEIFKVANLAVSKKFFADEVKPSIKEVASRAGVSEKQVHWWKDLLVNEGPRIFSDLRPGRKKEDFSCLDDSPKLLIYETINHLLVEEMYDGRQMRLSAEVREKILRERARLKEDYRLSYEDFSDLVGIPSGSMRRWSAREKQEGKEGLKEKSRAPVNRPRKLPAEIIEKIGSEGATWSRKHTGRIRITEFAASFRESQRKLLSQHGKESISDKTIARYLKEAGLYEAKEERPKGKRGSYRFFFIGAQFLIDTTVLMLLGTKAKLISVMDAASRRIFHQEAFLRETARNVRTTIRCSLKKAGGLGVKVFSILSDHGRPYKAKIVGEYVREQGCLKTYSPPYRPQGKAPLERYFLTLKQALATKWDIFRLFLKGIVVWIKDRVLIGFLNLVLTGFNVRYENTPNQWIDGKTPNERSSSQVSRQYQEATRKVLEEQEGKSQLKKELIGSLHKEFGLLMPKTKAKNYLCRFRKESIEKAAGALRRKLVVADIDPMGRWFYLSKVASNIEEKKKEAELTHAGDVIRQEKEKEKKLEERQKIEQERRWLEEHPEEALDAAVEWVLVFRGNEIARHHYEKDITQSLHRILMRHSRLTAALVVQKICRRIREKKSLEKKEVIETCKENDLALPEGEDLKKATDEIADFIQRSYIRFKEEIPAFQGLRQLWKKGIAHMCVRKSIFRDGWYDLG